MALLALVAPLLLLGSERSFADDRPAGGTPPAARTDKPAAGAKSGLGLDSILKPRSLQTGAGAATPQTPGGKNRDEWAQVFETQRREIKDLEGKVEVSRGKLAAASGGGEYQYSPLGGGTTTDPETLKLRTALKRDRESLEDARRRLRDLEVEASLAGVPREWFEPKGGSGSR